MDILLTDPVSGQRTGLERTVIRTLSALSGSGVRYSVIGAVALAVRGFPRMTRDFDVVLRAADAEHTVSALHDAGLQQETPSGPKDAPEPMIVFSDPSRTVEVRLHLAAGDPEDTVIDQARRARVLGMEAPVALLEHLLLLYLYSNQPKHLGDFATIIRSGQAELGKVERTLAEIHPEMLPEWGRRVLSAQSPPPAPARPAPRKRRR